MTYKARKNIFLKIWNFGFGYTRRNIRDTARRLYFMRITAHQLGQDMLKCGNTISRLSSAIVELDDRYRCASGSNLVINVVSFASSRRERRHFKGLFPTAATKGRVPRIRYCRVIRRIRRFLLEWRSRETIKGDIPRRQESAELLPGRKPASRAWRFGEEISGSLPTRLLVIGVASVSCRGRRLNSRECRFNRAQSAGYNANYVGARLIDLCICRENAGNFVWKFTQCFMQH